MRSAQVACVNTAMGSDIALSFTIPAKQWHAINAEAKRRNVSKIQLLRPVILDFVETLGTQENATGNKT
jgi:hypothetical protein